MLPNELPKSGEQPTLGQGMENLSPIGRKYFRLIEFDDAERLALEIRKHPVGLLFIILTGAFVIAAIVVVTIAILLGLRDKGVAATGASNYSSVVVLVGFLLAILSGASMAIGVYLYQSNVVFITNQKIAQVLYLTIFDRKISQLNIGDVQDVTVKQKGFLAHIFNYGTLVIETAGEQQNYTFSYVPDPYEASKTIIGLHEKNIAQFGN